MMAECDGAGPKIRGGWIRNVDWFLRYFFKSGKVFSFLYTVTTSNYVIIRKNNISSRLVFK